MRHLAPFLECLIERQVSFSHGHQRCNIVAVRPGAVDHVTKLIFTLGGDVRQSRVHGVQGFVQVADRACETDDRVRQLADEPLPIGNRRAVKHIRLFEKAMRHVDFRQRGTAIHHRVQVPVTVVSDVFLIVFQSEVSAIHCGSRLGAEYANGIVFVKLFGAQLRVPRGLGQK